MLHIHNGDSAADSAKQSSLTGEHVAWRESLITGPTPRGLSDSEWRTARSSHLSEAYGVDIQECQRGLLNQEETLAAFSEHHEVVLWFEHDLFCQLHLLYLLDWFSRRALGKTKLSLICIREFPGRKNFRGLGELTPDELASLFPGRRQVTQSQLGLATAAWQAYCSAYPTDIEELLKTDTSALPFLDRALRAHLERFPSTKNGLGRIESRALQLIHDGLDRFNDLFPKFGAAEPVYGLGDAQFCLALRQMSAASQPLIKIKGTVNEEINPQVLTPDIVQRAKLELTELGQSVRKDEADFVVLNRIDLWLGGVHLSTLNVWRWDEQSRGLVFPSSGTV